MKGKTLLHALGFVVLIGFVLPFLIFAVPQIIGASQSYVVLSGSMEPAISAGDVVIVDSVNPEAIDEGDVITFEPPSGHQQASAERVTHRVVEVVKREDGTSFRTKGDANEEPDRALVQAENVVGRVSLTIPKMGYVVQFAGSDQGLLLLVIVPSVLLIVSELYDLVRRARADSESTVEGTEARNTGSREEKSDTGSFNWQDGDS